MSSGIYVHIPFCLQKCFYCDFISYAGIVEQDKERYVAALCNEIKKCSESMRQTVDTVYFGGGTPTVLSAGILAKILKTIKKEFEITPDAEISIEANPETLNEKNLQLLLQAGFNRLSIGVQSLENAVLTAVGRVHDKDKALQAVMHAYKAGFRNISVDLICGLPGQNSANMRETMKKIVSLPIQHVSFYGLKVEQNTYLAEMLENGKISLPSEDEEDEMYEETLSMLKKHGFKRYEISNFAKDGKECRHNLKYWHYKEYLGFGAGACSFIDGCRRQNTGDLLQYISTVLHNEHLDDAICEHLSEQEQIGEYIFLHLRTSTGLFREEFKKYFGRTLEDCWNKYAESSSFNNIIADLSAKGLLKYDDARICLTELGMKFGNRVFAEFLL